MSGGTQKDGAGYQHGRQLLARISKTGKVTYYRGDLSSHRTVAEIDALNDSRRVAPQAGSEGHG